MIDILFRVNLFIHDNTKNIITKNNRIPKLNEFGNYSGYFINFPPDIMCLMLVVILIIFLFF